MKLPIAEEFVAHAGTVNCIKIGRKSSGVLVTGGEDKKVNLWTIGTQTKALVSESCQASRVKHCALMYEVQQPKRGDHLPCAELARASVTRGQCHV